MMLKGKDIILISNQMMNDRYWTSKQYITMELIKNNRVLYVEANYSFGKLFSGIIGKKWPVSPFGRMTIKKDSLTILTPFPRLPLRNHFRWIGWLNQKLLLFKIRKATNKLNFERPIFWTFLHQTADLVGEMNESVTVYHCVDDWPERFVMMNMGRRSVIKTDEKSMLDSADLVISVSPGLLSDYEIEKSKFKMIPNGVDLKIFKSQEQKYENPPDLKGITKPIIGFVGSIGKWIDLDLYQYLLNNCPIYSFVMIGLNERKKEIAKYNKYKNFYYLGLKPQHDVPNYIKSFDVCLMPFNQTRIAKSLLPQKMFQYFSMGKPVVSTETPALQDFNETLYISKNYDKFISNIQIALEENLNNKVERIEFAKQYSWTNRLIEYENAIKAVIK